jgi:hypothetical protein
VTWTDFYLCEEARAGECEGDRHHRHTREIDEDDDPSMFEVYPVTH